MRENNDLFFFSEKPGRRSSKRSRRKDGSKSKDAKLNLQMVVRILRQFGKGEKRRGRRRKKRKRRRR